MKHRRASREARGPTVKTRGTWKQLLEWASPAILLLLSIQPAIVASPQEKNATPPEKGTGQYAGVDTWQAP